MTLDERKMLMEMPAVQELLREVKSDDWVQYHTKIRIALIEAAKGLIETAWMEHVAIPGNTMLVAAEKYLIEEFNDTPDEE